MQIIDNAQNMHRWNLPALSSSWRLSSIGRIICSGLIARPIMEGRLERTRYLDVPGALRNKATPAVYGKAKLRSCKRISKIKFITRENEINTLHSLFSFIRRKLYHRLAQVPVQLLLISYNFPMNRTIIQCRLKWNILYIYILTYIPC